MHAVSRRDRVRLSFPGQRRAGDNAGPGTMKHRGERRVGERGKVGERRSICDNEGPVARRERPRGPCA